MKVYIGPYKNWVGPYQIAEKLLFWKNKWHPDYETSQRHNDEIHDFGEKLSKLPGLTRLCLWIDSKRKRKVKVRIDYYDTWSADHTLAQIIVPVLKDLKAKKHGSPFVDNEDVPEHLRSTAARPLTSEEEENGTPDELFHARWEWVMDEMIWAFEQHATDDWEDQYYSSGNDDMRVDASNDNQRVLDSCRSFKVDVDGRNAHLSRMANGRRLFAKYYQSLWD